MSWLEDSNLFDIYKIQILNVAKRSKKQHVNFYKFWNISNLKQKNYNNDLKIIIIMNLLGALFLCTSIGSCIALLHLQNMVHFILTMISAVLILATFTFIHLRWKTIGNVDYFPSIKGSPPFIFGIFWPQKCLYLI